MAAAAGIFSQRLAASQALQSKSSTPAAATANDTSNTSTSTTDSATISANDFLTLLVTEMQNQDPTADTDPNEYINQLVNVNSLEQLIDINQNLSTALGTSSTGATSDAAAAPAASVAGKSASGAAAQVSAATQSSGSSAGANYAPGNLSVPDATPAALRVAQALSGRTSAQ